MMGRLTGELSAPQLMGLLLWRGGLMLIAGYSLFRSVRFVLGSVDLPAELEVGLALMATGAGFVMGSLIVERVRDAREEGDLRD